MTKRYDLWVHNPYHALVLGLAPIVHASTRVDWALIIALGAVLVVPATHIGGILLRAWLPKAGRFLASLVIAAGVISLYELVVRLRFPNVDRTTIFMLRALTIMPLTWWPDALRPQHYIDWKRCVAGSVGLAGAFVVALSLLTVVRVGLIAAGVSLAATTAGAFGVIGLGLLGVRAVRTAMGRSARVDEDAEGVS